MEEIDGDLEVVEMEKIVAIQEVEVEVIVENTMVVVIVEVIVGAIPGVVVLLVIVQVSNNKFILYYLHFHDSTETDLQILYCVKRFVCLQK